MDEGGRSGGRWRHALMAALDRTPGPIAWRLRNNEVLARTLAPVLNRLVPPSLTEVSVRSGRAAGLRIVIDPRREKFYWAGIHEEEVQQAVCETLSPGGVFWDIGAHCGFFSGLAARAVGSTGRVLALEPMPENFARVVQSKRANEFEQMDVRNVAVGATSGTAWLIPHAESTMWSVNPVPAADAHSEVRVVCLDELLETEGAPDLVKIDVEGGEIAVLEGGPRLLARPGLRLLVEFHDGQLLEQARRMVPNGRFTHLGHLQWSIET